MIEPKLPTRFVEGMRLWLLYGVRPGSFFFAVLCNDLRNAIGYADPYSLVELPGIVSWLHNEAPAAAWGSPEQCKAWHEERRKVHEDVQKEQAKLLASGG